MAVASPWLSALLLLLHCVAYTAGLASTAASSYVRPQKYGSATCSHGSSPLLAVQSQAHAMHVSLMRPMLQSQCAAAGRLAAVRMLAEDPDPSEDNYYRTLGVSEDASYDEIMDAYIALTETYSEDAKRLAAVEKAKEAILDTRLRQRMSGALSPKVADSPFDDKPVKRTPPWVIAARIYKKMARLPPRKLALQIFALMGSLLTATWLSPRSAGTCLLINTLAGFGYLYNNGLPEVPKDDYGQIGEIRPMQPRPMALALGITTSIWFAGYFQARRMIALMLVPQWLPEVVLRTTFISLGLIFTALFVKVHDVFD